MNIFFPILDTIKEVFNTETELDIIIQNNWELVKELEGMRPMSAQDIKQYLEHKHKYNSEPSYREWWWQNKDRILSEMKNDMNLTIEDLKVIRLALNNVSISTALLNTINNVDAELAKHNLKIQSHIKPKRPYQRRSEIEYTFEPINK